MTPTLPFLKFRTTDKTVEQQVAEVVEHYLAAAAWTENFAVGGNWTPEAVELATFEVTAFLHLARWNIQDWSLEQLGNDFWLTRNGHGAGFWNRDIGTEAARTSLTDLAHLFGERDAYQEEENGLFYFE